MLDTRNAESLWIWPKNWTSSCFFASYSPILNLIERLWKFVKKECLYLIYYENFDVFKKAISSCLLQTHSTYKEELDSLLRLNFQTFKESNIIAL